MEQNFRFSATKHPHQLYISELQFWKLLRLFSEMHLQTQIGMMSFGKQNVESEQGRGKRQALPRDHVPLHALTRLRPCGWDLHRLLAQVDFVEEQCDIAGLAFVFVCVACWVWSVG